MNTTQKINTYSPKESGVKYNIYRESFVFVLDLIQFTEQLKINKKKTLAKQLLKSGTAIGEVINELKLSDNDIDKVDKTKQLFKNVSYIKYLLQLCKYSATYPNPNNLIIDIDKLIKQISLTIVEKRENFIAVS